MTAMVRARFVTLYRWGVHSMAEGKHMARAARKQAITPQGTARHSHFYERCAHWSFNRSGEVEPIRWHRERWVLAGTALLITLLSGFIMPAWASAMRPAPTPDGARPAAAGAAQGSPGNHSVADGGRLAARAGAAGPDAVRYLHRPRPRHERPAAGDGCGGRCASPRCTASARAGVRFPARQRRQPRRACASIATRPAAP